MKYKIKTLHLVAAIFLIAAVLEFYGAYYENVFTPYENMIQDKCYQKTRPIDERIQMIVVDDNSIKKIGQWPWNRSVHAKLIDILSKGKPAAIGMDILFSEKSSDPKADKELVDSAKRARNLVFASYGDFPDTSKAGTIIAKRYFQPFEGLQAVSKAGHINVVMDSDGFIRRSLNKFKYNNEIISSFDLQLYKQYLESTGKKLSNLKIRQDNWNRSYIDFVEKANQFTPIPYYKVLDGSFPPDWFKDKIVLIGPYTVGINDSYYTSIDKNNHTYGIEIHANILQNMLNNNFKQYAPISINLVVLSIFSILCFVFLRKFNFIKSILSILICIGGYFYISEIIYKNGYILSLLYPTMMIVITYLAVLIYNYVCELIERKRITNIFGRYVAPQVVSQILKNGEDGLKLGGVRKEISVLFVDIRGFTPMSEKAEPEEIVDILNEYLDLCAQSIFKYNGTLDKFIGDATMAIFNAPLELPDHALKAVQTALAMKEGSAVLQRKIEEKFGRSVQFGIGINTGFAVVGNIGSKSRMDYTAIGDTVNTSARLESNAKPGQILISQSTYSLVMDKVEAEYLGEINVKGKTKGIPVYQLKGLKSQDNLNNEVAK